MKTNLEKHVHVLRIRTSRGIRVILLKNVYVRHTHTVLLHLKLKSAVERKCGTRANQASVVFTVTHVCVFM